ncbi:MAG: VOC family protein [Spirochaetes bacterium]|nr:VOC family protein [Spirochaetota bacterium]
MIPTHLQCNQHPLTHIAGTGFLVRSCPSPRSQRARPSTQAPAVSCAGCPRVVPGGQCGWLKDRFGVSWQVVPRVLEELMADPARSKRVVDAFLKMKKFDIEGLMRA